jgi:DNA-binding NtrC family response regulator
VIKRAKRVNGYGVTAIAHQRTSPTILIVDDDASLRLLCRVNLELEGYNVLEAPSVAVAEDVVASDDVDLFLRRVLLRRHGFLFPSHCSM